MTSVQHRSGGTRRSRRRAWLPLALMAGIAVSSHRALPIELPHESDKLLHALVFGALAGLWAWALAPLSWSPRRVAVRALSISALWGALDEVHQAFVPGRTPAVLDAAADAAGALGACALWWRLGPHVRRCPGRGA